MNQKFLRKLPRDSNKYSHGTVAVIAGSSEYAGAAVLCVGGARRGGSGYINFLNRDEFTRTQVVSAYPDVVVRKKIKDLRVDAWVIGSGSPQLKRRFNIPRSRFAVLDAGAMRLARKINAEIVVITPHEGEARKLGFTIGEGEQGRQQSAQEMAEKLGCIVVLKGAHTVVASPDGLVVVDDLAGPELATAGTGDILAGLIGSMLASWSPETIHEAVVVIFKAVSAHALAARAAAVELSPITSSDILKYLPITIKQ